MELKEYREEIDEIDKKIINMLYARDKITRKIGEIKKEQNTKIYNNEREMKQNKKYLEQAKKHTLCEEYIIKIFNEIREHSKKKQKEHIK